MTAPRATRSGGQSGLSRVLAFVAAGFAGAGAMAAYGARLAMRGDLTLDVGHGRTRRTLGPFGVDITAPRQVVFDVIADPYVGRTPHAMSDKLQVLERGSDMVLAAHYTQAGPRLVTTTVETVRFSPPELVSFRLVRGPVPEVTETFRLSDSAAGTRLDYSGELGSDFWIVGKWSARYVAAKWEETVRASLGDIKTEAERRATRTFAGAHSPERNT